MGLPQIGLEAVFKNKDFLNALKGYNDAISQAEKDTDKAGQGMGASISKAVSAIGGITVAAGAVVVTGLVAAFGAIGKAAWDAGNAVMDAMDNIIASTTATDEEMVGLTEDFKAVMLAVPASAEQISGVMSVLYARVGLTGESLQGLTEQMTELARLTKSDAVTATQEFTRVMGDWSLSGDDANKTLDKFYVAAKKAGVPVSGLMTKAVQFGSPLRLMGFSIDQTISMLAKWEKEGVNTELVMGSLRIAAGKFADEGKPLQESLWNTIEAIQSNTDATAALAMGMDVFGARAGPDMVAAIREGRFAIDDYTAALAKSDDAIMKTGERVMDWPEFMQKVSNGIKVALDPIGSQLLDLANQVTEQFLPAFQQYVVPFINNVLLPAFTSIVDFANKLIQGDVAGAFKSLLPEGLVNDVINLGKAVQDTFTNLFSSTSWEDIPAGFDAATGQMIAGAPGLKSRLVALGAQIVEYIGEGLLTIVDQAGKLISGFTDWLNSGGLDDIWTVGQEVGETVVEAIGALIGIGTSDTSKSISQMLYDAVAELDLSASSAFGTLFTGVWIGGLKSVFGSGPMLDATRNVIADYYAVMFTPGKTVGNIVGSISSDMGAATAELKPTFGQSATMLWDSFTGGLEFGWQKVSQNWQITSANLAKLITGGDATGGVGSVIGTWITDQLTIAGGAISGAFGPIIQAIGGGLASAWQSVSGFFADLGLAIYGFFTGIGQTIGTINSVILAIVTWPFVKAYEWFASWVPDVLAWIKDTWNSISVRIGDNAKSIWEAIKAPFVSAYTGFIEWANDAWQWIRETWTEIQNVINEYLVPLWDTIKQPFINAWDSIAQWASDVWQWVTDTWTTIKTKIGENSTKVSDSIKEPFDEAWTWIKDIAQDIIDLFANIKIHIPLPKFSLSWSEEDISPLFPGVKWPQFGVTWAANGLQGYFNQPTLIGVGEAGPEYVSVMPARGSEPGRMSQPAGVMGGNITEVHYHLHITSNAETENVLGDYLALAEMGAQLG